jgi:uncharacterized protein YegP (UPF0339 family)
VRHQLDVYRREDRRWGWRLRCANGRVVAQHVGDGYRDRAMAAMTARELLAGDLEVVVEEERSLAVFEVAVPAHAPPRTRGARHARAG